MGAVSPGSGAPNSRTAELSLLIIDSPNSRVPLNADYPGARQTAQAAKAEPSAITRYPAVQPDALATPPNLSSTVPTATGARKPVVNPASAYSASAAPRCAGSAAATAPPASAPTSAKLVI